MADVWLFRENFRGFLLTSPRLTRLSLIAAPKELRWLAGQAEQSPRSQERSGPRVNGPWEEHLDVVYRYALRLSHDDQLARELTQETMLRGWRGRSALREPTAARSWLLKIATNTWTDWQRRWPHEPRLLEAEPPSREPSNIKTLIHREQVALALAALDELPPRQRQVMHLVTVEQIEQSEVAEILGISVASVKANLSAGRKAMRERLRDVYEQLGGNRRCPTEK